jgi:WD40 repeat protein
LDIDNQGNPVEFGKSLDGSFAEINDQGSMLAVYKYNSNQSEYDISLYQVPLQESDEFQLINPQPVSASNFAFSPNGQMVAYSSDDGVAIWTGESVSKKSLKIYPGLVSGIKFNGDGSILAIFGNRGVQLWDAMKNEPVGKPIPGPAIAGTGIAISPDGKTVASFASDGIVLQNLENMDTYLPLELGEYTGQLTDRMSFTSDGSQFLDLGDDDTLIRWDVATGKQEIARKENQPLKGKSPTNAVFSTDGRYLAYATVVGMNIWDINNGLMYATAGEFPDTENDLGAINFSPDGTFLAYSDGPRIMLWNIPKKEAIGETLLTDATTISQVYPITSEGTLKYIVTVDESGVTQIWDWASRTRIGLPMDASLKIVGFDTQQNTTYYIDSAGRLIKWKWGLGNNEWQDLLCPLIKRTFKQEEWKTFLSEKYPESKELLPCQAYSAAQ